MAFSNNTYGEMLNMLRAALANGPSNAAYEIAELIFRYKGNPVFYYVCIQCIMELRLKPEIDKLLQACKIDSLREFLRGTYLSFDRRWVDATNAFANSIRADSTDRYFPIYLISREKDIVSFKMEKHTIAKAARSNMRIIHSVQYRNIEKFSIEWPDISPQNIDIYSYQYEDTCADDDPTKSHKPISEKIQRVQVDETQVGTSRNDASGLPMPDIAAGQNIWHKEGTIWSVTYENKTKPFHDLKGMRYMAQLLAKPGKSISAAELMETSKKRPTGPKTDISNGIDPELIENIGKMSDEQLDEQQLSRGGLSSAGDITDKDTIRDVKERILELEDSLGIAKDTRDSDRESIIREELNKLKKYLAGGVNIRGELRKDKDSDERIMKAVSRCIKYSCSVIKDEHPSLGHHLDISIKRRGHHFRYGPDRPIKWDVKI